MRKQESIKALHPAFKIAVVVAALLVVLVGAIGCNKTAKSQTATSTKVSATKKTDHTNSTTKTKEKTESIKEETGTAKAKK